MTHPIFTHRSSGVLLHISSLPGQYGSGDLGVAARHFVDWLVSAKQSLWQILPLSPIGPGNSPYQSPSSMAGNPLLVDIDDLVQNGWLEWQPDLGLDRTRCDYQRVIPLRMDRLRRAWTGFRRTASTSDQAFLKRFCIEQQDWLQDYALFMALETRYGSPWTCWPVGLAFRDEAALDQATVELDDELGFWSFVQWRFSVQWQRLRDYANEHGVWIVGDAPIFVAHHSADVWANVSQFWLDAAGEPTCVAGVPPDYFSATGQRWGNPLYRWERMAEDDYGWWQSRLRKLLSMLDVIRLDHFRGFESYWEVPADQPTAQAGQWRPGPGKALFDVLNTTLGPLPLIAEDLGVITPEVVDLRLACDLPGMRILQFAFNDGAGNPYRPHNFVTRTVAYTGTHDNDTAIGWWSHASERERQAARDYLGTEADREIHWAMMQSLSQSVANTVVFPFQDVLGLDSSHRLNTPGFTKGCWEWRFDWSMVGEAPAQRLSALASAHGRH